MSHTNVVYPQFSNQDLDLTHTSRWQVREDEDKYDNKADIPVLTQLSNLSDFITEKLTRAETLSWVLQGARHYPANADSVAALVIAELLHEALEANEKQWEKIKEVVKREGEDLLTKPRQCLLPVF